MAEVLTLGIRFDKTDVRRLKLEIMVRIKSTPIPLLLLPAAFMLVLLACGGGGSAYLNQMAEFHVDWGSAFTPEEKSELLTSLSKIELHRTGGPERLRHEEYARVHQLDLQTDIVASRLRDEVTNALEPHTIDYFFFCTDYFPNPESEHLEAVLFIERNPEVLAQAGVELEEVKTGCLVVHLARRQQVSVRYEAETTWLKKQYQRARDRKYAEITARSKATEPDSKGFEELNISWILGTSETSIRCPTCTTLEVTGVVDGETLETTDGVVQLYGVDAPEKGERCFGTAADTLSSFAFIDADYDSKLDKLVGTVRVEAGPRATDQYGRLLYYVYTGSGNSIDEILVTMGVANASTREGQHRDQLHQMQARAPQDKQNCFVR